jgi:hypothetical protein
LQSHVVDVLVPNVGLRGLFFVGLFLPKVVARSGWERRAGVGDGRGRLRAAVADLPLAEQKKLFHDNAARIYRL